jgi:hypothetical protein
VPRFDPSDLVTGVSWWELAGHHDPAGLAAAWGQCGRALAAAHALALAAAVDQNVAADQNVALQAGFTWIPHRRLHQQLLAGPLLPSPLSCRAVFRPWDFVLILVDGLGSPIDALELKDVTADQARAWLVETAWGRAAMPPPDLRPADPHAVFPEPNQLALAEVLRLYGNTDAVLIRLAQLAEAEGLAVGLPVALPAGSGEGWAEGMIEGWAAGEPLIEQPGGEHTVTLRGAGRSVTLGLSPPSAEGRGPCWFAGLTASRDRAELPVAQVTDTHDPAEQQGRLATFLSRTLTTLLSAESTLD